MSDIQKNSTPAHNEKTDKSTNMDPLHFCDTVNESNNICNTQWVQLYSTAAYFPLKPSEIDRDVYKTYFDSFSDQCKDSAAAGCLDRAKKTIPYSKDFDRSGLMMWVCTLESLCRKEAGLPMKQCRASKLLKRWGYDDGPADPFATGSASPEGTAFHNPDYVALRRAWINEVRCPELLPYQTDTVENIMKSLRPQWTLISARQGQWAAGRDSYLRDILVMEADRVGYVLKSYLRVRISKIQKYARYYVMLGSSGILSATELKFAVNHLSITEQAFKSMFLRHLPQDDEYFQTLVASDDPGGDMICRPNLEQVVFAKVTEPIGTIATGHDETATLDKDRSYMIRYSLVQDFLRQNRVELM